MRERIRHLFLAAPPRPCWRLLSEIPAAAQQKNAHEPVKYELRKISSDFRFPRDWMSSPCEFRADNPITPEKIKLGKLLFFDRALSNDNTVSVRRLSPPEPGFHRWQAGRNRH